MSRNYIILLGLFYITQLVLGHRDQTEAYFSVISKRFIDKKLSPLRMIHYETFFDRISAVGNAYPDHYYFVHGYDKELCALHDFYRLFNAAVPKQYGGLRKTSDLQKMYVSEYLRVHVHDLCDSTQCYQRDLLSVNLSAVGNLTRDESAYACTMENKSWATPEDLYDSYLQELDPRFVGVLGVYIKQRLLTISKLLVGKEGAMMQILIPCDKVDHYVYLSEAYGAVVREKIPLSNGRFLEDGYDERLGYYTSIRSLLDLYTARPDLLKDYLPKAQARLLMHKDFLDVESGIEFVRHLTVPREKIAEYDEAVYDLVGEITEIIAGVRASDPRARL